MLITILPRTVNKDCLNATAVVRQRIGQIEEELLSLKQTLEMLNWRSSSESSKKLDRQVQFDVSKSSATSGYQWSGDGDGAPNRRCRIFNSDTQQKNMTSLSRLTLSKLNFVVQFGKNSANPFACLVNCMQKQ
ncbi:hypothetical protein T4E_7212 [Trichinella pseudospiralis]|uniref:Uncharacterized protein n=1 Tax=Trichinella pseudospiralis TaxID=6337 RepID=A0A0V0XVG1_TRIPS|nr:hypothetical protein T4E_7212 [Trichinella pseudospiralis]